MKNITRRDFIKKSSAIAIGSTLPVSVIHLGFGSTKEDFTFAYISDSHIQHIKGNKFVRNWDHGLKRAVAETNLLIPKPDFVLLDWKGLGKEKQRIIKTMEKLGLEVKRTDRLLM